MNIEMIRAAAARLQGHARETPLLSSPFLDEIAGRRVLVKAECLQHTGSFKYRGGRAALSALTPATRARGVIAFSSGNHAQGVARAAAEFGVPAVIVMPADAPALKIANTRALGAEVVLYDRATEDRDAIGTALAAERGLTLVKPFDEPPRTRARFSGVPPAPPKASHRRPRRGCCAPFRPGRNDHWPASPRAKY